MELIDIGSNLTHESFTDDRALVISAAAAAGVTVTRAKLAAFEAWLEENLAEKVAAARKGSAFSIDGLLTASACTPELVAIDGV